MMLVVQRLKAETLGGEKGGEAASVVHNQANQVWYLAERLVFCHDPAYFISASTCIVSLALVDLAPLVMQYCLRGRFAFSSQPPCPRPYPRFVGI